jgi:[ribosomal protein S5]-alanine N-acetyltransferase
MSDIVFRKGKNVLLRPLEEEDIPLILKGINDPEVTEFLKTHAPMSRPAEEEWFKNLHKRTSDYILAIVLNDDKRYIGNIALNQIRWKDGTAVTGTVIFDKECWGKGYGTEAKMLLLDYAFNTLGLRAVLSRVIERNLRSLKYADKCGYKEVGRIPKWIRGQDGVFRDEVLLVVTAEDWLPLWRKFKEE